jgi:hypothetical protein
MSTGVDVVVAAIAAIAAANKNTITDSRFFTIINGIL